MVSNEPTQSNLATLQFYDRVHCFQWIIASIIGSVSINFMGSFKTGSSAILKWLIACALEGAVDLVLAYLC